MPKFYSEHNMRKEFSAPQFTRMRHRFRGPRESEKINLEVGQLHYSVNKLFNIQNNFQNRFIENALTTLEGGTIDGVEDEFGDLAALGLGELAKRIDVLKRRVEALEA